MDPMTDLYWAATVSIDHEAAEAVTNFLWEAGATGVVEEAAGGATLLRAFFPPGTDPAELRERVTGYLDTLRALALPVGPGAVDMTPVRDEAWAEAWRAHFHPVPVGRRLLVCPPWETPPVPPDGPAGPRVVIVIEPGRAFGTGGHATTRGCLELIERTIGVTPAERVLDVGTGSGILAIAAACLGAPQVLAIDIDPDAVLAARENAVRNAVADRVRVELGSLDGCPEGAHDLVLANLLGPTLVTLAPTLARSVASRARLVLGGLIVPEVPLVVAWFVPEGVSRVEGVERESWAALLLARNGQGRA